jgi:hypothetical protein
MTSAAFVLTRGQRDEILRAVRAIERQLKEAAGQPQWQVNWVIATNLTIIESQLTEWPEGRG